MHNKETDKSVSVEWTIVYYNYGRYGFNVEYRIGGFALIFLAEYARILFIRILFCVIFLASDVNSLMFYFQLRFLLSLYQQSG